jgi:hypothetical protein
MLPKNTYSWKAHGHFAIEDEVNQAVIEHYTSDGYAMEPLRYSLRGMGKGDSALLNPRGGTSYSFGGMYVATKGEEKLLLLGEAKHCLGAGDIQTLGNNAQKLLTSFSNIKYGAVPAGSGAFQRQLLVLGCVADYPLKFYAGDVRVMPKTLEKAVEEGCDVVVAFGGRFSYLTTEKAAAMTQEWIVSVPADADADR